MEQNSLRFALPDDADELAPLNYQLIRDEGHRNPMTVGQLAERMRGWLQGDYRAVLYIPRKQIVAYALFREQPQEIYLRHLFVCVAYRRQGIGRALVRHLIDHVWPHDKRLTVEVLTRNQPAVAFWRVVGYQDYSLTLEILPPGLH